jgi:hypothetical protein
MDLDPPLVHAPEIPAGPWIGTPPPLPWSESDQQVLVVGFWDFTCVSCLRTLPYLRAWNRIYSPYILMIGFHTPEFSFARDARWVKSAAGRLGIRWPILTDNQQDQWTRWTVPAWPTVFLVDADGFIRLRHSGDAGYGAVEDCLRTLLQDRSPEEELPPPVGSLREEDEPGAVCFPVTPELQADEAGLPVQGLAAAMAIQHPPEPSKAIRDGYDLDGDWIRIDDGWRLEHGSGRLTLTYAAAQVFAVMAPDRAGEAGSEGVLDYPTIVLELDGRTPDGECFGEDVFRTQAGAGLRLDMPRLYNLVKDTTVSRHELCLRFAEPGPTFYAFSFGSCLMPPTDPSPT